MNKTHVYKTTNDLTIELLKGKSEPILWNIYEDNRTIVPVSPTITLKKPDQSDFPVAVVEQAMTVAGGGAVSYTMPTANTGQLLENCTGTIHYVFDSVAYQFGFLFDIVRSRLEMVITDEDLFDEFPGLRESGYRQIGAASAAGTVSTLVDTAQLIQPDDFWTGGAVEFPASGERRSVTDFDSATATLSFAPALAVATAPGSKYIVSRSFRKERARAFQDIIERLRNAGRRAALIVDSHQLRTAHILLTLAKIFRGFVNSETYRQLSRDYAEMYDRLFQELRLDYDANEDGAINDSEGLQSNQGMLERS
ncbi:MAG: hypothetical protein ACE5G9_13670 [Nitrospinales bacterium]